MKPQGFFFLQTDQIPVFTSNSVFGIVLWTRGESNPFPFHAMEVYYRYTTGPHGTETAFPSQRSFTPKVSDAIYSHIARVRRILPCGPDRSRTGDLRNANAALYQLSYG